jgi:hypothetical protein
MPAIQRTCWALAARQDQPDVGSDSNSPLASAEAGFGDIEDRLRILGSEL